MKTKPINYYLRSTENQHQDETLPPQVQTSESNEQHYQSTLEIAPSDSEEQHPQSTTEAPASESEDQHFQSIPASESENQEIETLDEEQIPEDHITQSSTDHQPLEEQQIRNRIMATGINLKKFDGSENVHLWITVLENWQKFHNVSDSEALLAIGCNFEGQAATWLQTLSPAQKNNLTTFKDCLKSRFANKETNSLLGLRQYPGESTNDYLSRAEKTSLGHDLPEIYKVQFTTNGLIHTIKKCVISKEPKTFQELRHAVDLAKQELECDNKQDFDIQSLTSQIRETLKSEISALTATQERPFQNQKRKPHNPGRESFSQTPQAQAPWNQPGQSFSHPAQSFSQPNQSFSHPAQFNQPGQSFNQPGQPFQWMVPPSPWPQQQWFQPMNQPTNRRGRKTCSGCGKFCFSRSACPAFNVKCSNCGNWRHFASVCRTNPTPPHTSQHVTTNHQQSNNHSNQPTFQNSSY